jgi:GNAT superfamily N-acetyltransferase
MKYTYNRLSEPFDGANLLPFYFMTFPRLIGLLNKLNDDPRILAVEAKREEEAVGLALAFIRPDRHSAKVLSLFVKREHRNRGIGANLLAHLEGIAKEQGCMRLSMTYFDSLPAAAALQKVLERSGWSPPELCFIELKAYGEFVVQSEWVWKQRPLPQGFEIFRWTDLTEEDRQSILRRQQEKPWYPRNFSPFKEERFEPLDRLGLRDQSEGDGWMINAFKEDQFEPLNSLGLRYQGEVVGWMITHRVNPDTIRYTLFFVDESVRNPSAVFMLVTESIRLQCQSELRNFVHHYLPDSPIRKWAERHLGEHATINHLMKSTKRLVISP